MTTLKFEEIWLEILDLCLTLRQRKLEKKIKQRSIVTQSSFS